MTATSPTTAPLQWPAGYRINPRAEGPSAEIVAGFREIPVAAIGDSMSRNVGTVGLRQYHGRLDTVLCGPAVTVRVRPGDNLMIHKALMMVQPGDVLVIDGKGDQSSALMGTIMMNACRQRGIAGVVIDGAVRDSLDIDDMDYPVFSVGTNPNGPTKEVGGRIGHPVSVGGVTVHPGDFICGDADGLVVVEREKIASLLPLAEHKEAAEARRIAQIKEGKTNAPWLVASLITAGVLKEGETL